MKKIISLLLGAVIATATITSNTQAQTPQKNAEFFNMKNNTSALADYVYENSETSIGAAGSSTSGSLTSAKTDLKASKANLKAMKANFKAAESFKKEFKDGPDAKWIVEDEVITATFVKDDVRTKSVFDKRGHWLHTLSYMPGEKTPADIRSIVENSFPNDDITLAVKVREGSMEFYIVQLEDKHSYKKIAVYDGEANLIEKLTKSN